MTDAQKARIAELDAMFAAAKGKDREMTDDEIRALLVWCAETGRDDDAELIERLANAALEARAELATMTAALVDHNDLLRSALQIAKREGVDGEIASTNWDAYYNRVAVVLKRHHETANAARAALQSTPAQKEQSE